jgi:hypothetical protein
MTNIIHRIREYKCERDSVIICLRITKGKSLRKDLIVRLIQIEVALEALLKFKTRASI